MSFTSSRGCLLPFHALCAPLKSLGPLSNVPRSCIQDIALSSGSACTSASLEPSYVLRALGAAEDMAHSSLRFGIGRFTTEAGIDLVVERIVSVVNRLRDMSPLWEMVQEGIDISKIEWAA